MKKYLNIQNPVHGQGYNPEHNQNPYHQLLTEFGFVYSHNTAINRRDGSKYAHITYLFPDTDFAVGISCDGIYDIECGRIGRTKYRFQTHSELTRYLERKVKELRKTK